MIPKPDSLFGRTAEWEALCEFVESGGGAKLGLVYGRRRQGKTRLLQTLARGYDGFYWQALEQSSRQNLMSLSIAWTAFTEAPTPYRFGDWREAFQAIFSAITGRPIPVVIDEVGYIINEAPELPSVLQAALAPLDAEESTARLLLCGSSFGQMRRLVDPQAPLRGRAGVTIVVRPFSYIESAAFWGVENNLDAAFCLHALVGGTPAYRSLADATPTRGDVRGWAIRRLLDPRSPLFREGQVVVAEDPSLGDRQLYWSVLAGLIDGHERRRDLAEAMDRPETSLSHAFEVLAEAGWITRIVDPLRARRARYRVIEPMIRSWRLLIEPNAARLELGGARQAQRVWDDADPTISARIYGSHLEQMAAEWVLLHAEPRVFGGRVDLVGPSEVKVDGEFKQVDLIATSVSPSGDKEVLVVGEVKATRRPVGEGELARLDGIAAVVAPDARRLVVARAGFTSALRRAAELRSDVVLADLTTLYDQGTGSTT